MWRKFVSLQHKSACSLPSPTVRRDVLDGITQPTRRRTSSYLVNSSQYLHPLPELSLWPIGTPGDAILIPHLLHQRCNANLRSSVARNTQ